LCAAPSQFVRSSLYRGAKLCGTVPTAPNPQPRLSHDEQMGAADQRSQGTGTELVTYGHHCNRRVEIARALEVIPNVPSLCLAHTNDGVGCVSGQACFSLSRWLAKSVSFPIFAYFSLCFGLLSVECPFSVITPITPSIFVFSAEPELQTTESQPLLQRHRSNWCRSHR
jgi:hypothetical protein